VYCSNVSWSPHQNVPGSDAPVTDFAGFLTWHANLLKNFQ
jgi:hypothetical protein